MSRDGGGRDWPASEPLPADGGASAFEAAGGLTVGIEEELLLLDPVTLAPAPAAARALAAVGGDPRFERELKASQIEIATPVCRTPAEAARELASARLLLVERLAGTLRLAAVGSHPTSTDPGELSEGERYEALEDEYQWVARGSHACGLHVHVAAGGADRSLAVFNALRSYVPELAALSANSPFVGGEDTGLCSVRQLGETFPRTGIPPAFGSWDEFADYLRWGRRGKLFPDATHFWWDLRPHPGFGTIEARVMDAQTRVGDSAALAALCVCLVGDLVDRYDAGERLPVHPSHRIAENGWRALRYGPHGRLVDLETGEAEPARERLGRLIERLLPVAERLGCAHELGLARRLLSAGGADRQRAVAAREGLDGVVRRLVEETERAAADEPR